MNLKTKIKVKAKTQIVAFRRWLFASDSILVSWYYRKIWNPKPDSLGAEYLKFAKSHSDIFFVQIGGNDGFEHDPLSKFIKAYDWRGIILETQKKAFEQLQKLHYDNKIILEQSVISEQDTVRQLWRIAFSDARWASGLSSFLKSHLEAKIADGYVEHASKKTGTQLPADKKDWICADDVTCITFQTLAQKHQIPRVDVLQIDVEGYDFEILKLFDFEQFKPQLIVYESTALLPEDQKACQQFLEAKNYTLTHIERDTVAKL